MLTIKNQYEKQNQQNNTSPQKTILKKSKTLLNDHIRSKNRHSWIMTRASCPLLDNISVAAIISKKYGFLQQINEVCKYLIHET